ncbi:MAG: flagellar motor switch protein FliN [Armatimonadota bacterium]|nr:flagellar motor switch protein FliN [Armatimonadota bacterium]MDR7563600.1 flagellar motor switch protein FliN [Armatimonadota bacterium]MDR7566848.1 flagellar motor switch protein FliN [Armatimonadota bacterium]MDR7601205.1 flagellar motor switch protein FliN [Armatimonadota bacterium]
MADPYSVDPLDLLAELSNIGMGSAATTLSQLVRRRVRITAPRAELLRWSEVDRSSLVGHVGVGVHTSGAVISHSYLLLREEDVRVLVDLMMGGDGSMARPLDRELLLSGAGEAMNQMMGSASTALAEFLGSPVTISPPQVVVLEAEEAVERLLQPGDQVVRVTFRLDVEGLLETTFYQIYEASVLPQLVERSTQAARRVAGSPPPPPQASATPHAPAVRPVEFEPLEPRRTTSSDRNLDLLLDVPLQVTVELGRTRMRIRDVLSLGIGAVIELERAAGEPVDLYVNDRLFARGEVVVIEENFGVRVTEILSPEQRLRTLGRGPEDRT